MRIAPAITITRVSTNKQFQLGDSNENQEEQIDFLIKRIEQQDNVKIQIIADFPFVGSGQVSQEM